MKKHQQKQLKHQGQAILFCAILIWMVVSVLAAIPAMAFQPATTPEGLEKYEHVAKYEGYTYATNGNEEAVAHKEDGHWIMLCQRKTPFKTIELVQVCKIPVATARHLKTLSHEGMSHDMFIAEG